MADFGTDHFSSSDSKQKLANPRRDHPWVGIDDEDGAEMFVSRSFSVALERPLDRISGAGYGSGMNATVESAKKAWTEAELEALPEDGYIHEVVDGELVMSPKNNWFHGRICTRLIFALEAFNRLHRLGVVLDSSTGFWMFNRNCRAPDVSFVPKARLATLGFKPNEKRFFPGAPDLAVEILSPNNARAEIDARLKDFFASGTQIAWVVNPDEECVEVCHSPTNRKLIGSGGTWDGEHLLPGFTCPIADLFKEWDWE